MTASGSDVSLREYLETRINAVDESSRARDVAQDLATRAALLERENAISKVEMATEKRFESVNEFRAALADQARLMMPRQESEALHHAGRERHDGAINAMYERMSAITSRVDALAAEKTGKQIGWSSVVSVIALIASVVGVVMLLSRS